MISFLFYIFIIIIIIIITFSFVCYCFVVSSSKNNVLMQKRYHAGLMRYRMDFVTVMVMCYGDDDDDDDDNDDNDDNDVDGW